MENKVYSYDGPVFHFERAITNRWTGYTSAPTERKALANLSFKAKTKFGYDKGAKITLDSKFLKLEP